MIISGDGHDGAAGTSTAPEPATTSEDSEPESAAGVLVRQPVLGTAVLSESDGVELVEMDVPDGTGRGPGRQDTGESARQLPEAQRLAGASVGDGGEQLAPDRDPGGRKSGVEGKRGELRGWRII